MYTAVDQKVDNEIQSRAKSEEEFRAWIESKVQVLENGIRQDE